MCECVTDGAFSMCVLLPKSGGAVDQEDVGAAKCPGAASCWEEPGWSWSHIQGTGTTWFAHRRVHLYTGVYAVQLLVTDVPASSAEPDSLSYF